MRTSILAVALLPLLGCAKAPPPEPPADPAAIAAALDSLWVRWRQAALAGDSTAFGANLTEDVRMEFMGAPTLVGRPAAVTFIGGFFASARFSDVTVEPTDLIILGPRRAFQTGRYHETYTPTGKPAQVDYGRYGALFDRSPTGAWRVHRIVGLTDSAVVQRGRAAR